MKKTLLALLLIITQLSFSQDYFNGSIEWSTPISTKGKAGEPNPIGVAGGSFYSTQWVKKKIFLQKFNVKTLNLESKMELELEHKGEDLSDVSYFIFGNRVAITAYWVDKDAELKNYILAEVTNGVIENVVDLTSLPYIKSKTFGGKKHREEVRESGTNSFVSLLTLDNETLQIMYRVEDKKHVVLIDENMGEVARGEFDIDYENFAIDDLFLSNRGNSYFIVHEYNVVKSEKGLIKSERKEITDYHMFIYDPITDESNTIDIDFDKTIKSVSVEVLENDDIVVYGMFANENADGVSGAFFIRYDSEGNEIFTTLEEFEEDFITQYWTAAKKKSEEKKKKKRERKGQEVKAPSLYSYRLKRLAVKENGDLLLLAEQYYMYVTTHTYTDANGVSHTTYTYHYIYNDIIAVNCTKDGNVDWKEKINKKQHSINDGGYLSSFFTYVDGNQVKLIFNDNEASMAEADGAELTKKEKKKLKRKSVAAIVTFDEDGEVDRERLFEFEGEELKTIVPKRCESVDESTVLLYTIGNRRTRYLGLVEL